MVKSYFRRCHVVAVLCLDLSASFFVTMWDAASQPKGTPKVEFTQIGMKWVVENQGSSDGVVTIEVTDKKHQVWGSILSLACIDRIAVG